MPEKAAGQHATVAPRRSGTVGTWRFDPKPTIQTMNGKTAKLLRKFALASGSSLREIKALFKRTPRNRRFALKQETRKYLPTT